MALANRAYVLFFPIAFHLFILGGLLKWDVVSGDAISELENMLSSLEDDADMDKRLLGEFLQNGIDVFEDADWSGHGWQNETIKPSHVYDFVIVGSGSAGSVLANRLSENPKWKVLLLEIGKRENFISSIPLVAPIMQCSSYDWQYLMEYDPGFARGMEGNRLAWPRGKALGGSTVINYMIYTRGNPRDFDTWAAQGCPSWSYKEVLPYFLKSENSSLIYKDDRYHNTSGYWSVSNIYRSPLVHSFIKGGKQMGLKFVDYAAPNQMGFGYVEANVLNGRRHTVAKAFLDPIQERQNLHVLTSALVTKILINKANSTAYGVEYIMNEKKYRVFVNKEVIISAGALASPQLLMVSGIGPKENLEKLKIPVIVDAPVGQNLHDHVTYVGLNFIINQTISLSALTVLSSRSIQSYLRRGQGPFTSLGGVEGIGYIKTAVDTDPDPTYPDMEFLFVDASLSADYGIVNRRAMRIRDDVYNKLWGPLHNTPTWTIFPMLLHPKSTGHLELQSKDIKIPPKFYGNYFSDPEQHDVKTMIAAIRSVQQLSGTPAFQRFASGQHTIPVPGCEEHTFDSDTYWECALRTLSITLHHQVGTCKMGASPETGAVVDDQLRVFGIKGLRVIDTSVIPFAITAHTNAPSVMVGERGADLIKQAWPR